MAQAPWSIEMVGGVGDLCVSLILLMSTFRFPLPWWGKAWGRGAGWGCGVAGGGYSRWSQLVEGVLQLLQPLVAVGARAWVPVAAACCRLGSVDGQGSIPSFMCVYLDFHMLYVYIWGRNFCRMAGVGSGGGEECCRWLLRMSWEVFQNPNFTFKIGFLVRG